MAFHSPAGWGARLLETLTIIHQLKSELAYRESGFPFLKRNLTNAEEWITDLHGSKEDISDSQLPFLLEIDDPFFQ
jgi:hypothetical protein